MHRDGVSSCRAFRQPPIKFGRWQRRQQPKRVEVCRLSSLEKPSTAKEAAIRPYAVAVVSVPRFTSSGSASCSVAMIGAVVGRGRCGQWVQQGPSSSTALGASGTSAAGAARHGDPVVRHAGRSPIMRAIRNTDSVSISRSDTWRRQAIPATAARRCWNSSSRIEAKSIGVSHSPNQIISLDVGDDGNLGQQSTGDERALMSSPRCRVDIGPFVYRRLPNIGQQARTATADALAAKPQRGLQTEQFGGFVAFQHPVRATGACGFAGSWHRRRAL